MYNRSNGKGFEFMGRVNTFDNCDTFSDFEHKNRVCNLRY